MPIDQREGSDPAIAERFELFHPRHGIGQRLHELNDPDLQEGCSPGSWRPVGRRLDGEMDRDFIRVASWLPGRRLGIGIDRLIMLLTNSQSIREVILFRSCDRKRSEVKDKGCKG